ncbi:exo-alpha-sialidase OS=Streptomyces rimosus subsp. rimosus (strain ATCC / DSM 40260 / JCM 4667/ NRRL 2234) OX=1265868 GN=SRIM_033905 PE=3 SV=1 [Streptomyces rimosus subsp. rimosus]
MTIRSSYDEGRTWEGVDRGARITTDWSGYSDLVAVSPGLTGLLYEGGAADARDEIRFARFTDAWLGPRRGPDPTTPDHGRQRPARARAGRRPPGTGPLRGRALLRRPGTTPYGCPSAARSPWAAGTSRAASGSATAPRPASSRSCGWAGWAAAARRWPCAATRPCGRISASITALDGARPAATAEAATTAAYDDGRRHHLSLRRTGGRLSLAVDGAETRTVPDVPGSVSRNSVFGVHAGQKVDSRAHLAGDLDEVRVYGRALSDGELARVREENGRVRGPVVLDLPLDDVDGE